MHSRNCGWQQRWKMLDTRWYSWRVVCSIIMLQPLACKFPLPVCADKIHTWVIIDSLGHNFRSWCMRGRQLYFYFRQSCKRLDSTWIMFVKLWIVLDYMHVDVCSVLINGSAVVCCANMHWHSIWLLLSVIAIFNTTVCRSGDVSYRNTEWFSLTMSQDIHWTHSRLRFFS